MQRRSRPALILVVAALLLTGCGTGSEASRSSDEPPKGSERSHPFSVGDVPDGFELVVAGTGSAVPEWSNESVGSTPNLTVLRPRGGSVADDVLVSADGGDESFPSDVFLPAIDDTRPASGGGGRRSANMLQLARGEVQFYVEGRAEERKLRSVARAASLPDRTGAPVIADPLGDLEVVGSVDADAALALESGARLVSGSPPGPPSAHAIGWKGETADLVALTIPGRSLDLQVLADHPEAVVYGTAAERRTIAGRPAVILRPRLDPVPGGGAMPVTVLTETADGDVAMVAAIPHISFPVDGPILGPQPAVLPTDEVLMGVAASIRPVGQDAWSAFVEAANGGPGFHADPGAVALASGERSGIEWLLQDPPGADGTSVSGSGGPDATFTTDAVPGCLKLANGERPCANTGQGGGIAPGEFLSIRTGRSSIGSFAIVERSRGGGELRVTTLAGTDQRPMVAVPGEQRWVTVVFNEQPLSIFRCPAEPDQSRIEVVEDDGSTTCLGGSR